MTTPKTIIPQVILGPPRKKKDLGTFAQVVLKAFTGNVNFPNPNPTLVVLTAAIAAFFAAQAMAVTKAAGAVAARNDAWLALLRILQHLRDYVAQVIEASPTNAVSVIESAGMRVRKIVSRDKPQLAVKQEVSTTVELVAKALAASAVYYWEYSLDQKTWSSAPETFVANTTIAGLTVGQTYYFRFHGLTRKGKTDLSQVVSFVVR